MIDFPELRINDKYQQLANDLTRLFMKYHFTILQQQDVDKPMKDKVAVTYTDQGVYDDPIGKEVIVVVSKDGTVISQRAFAEQHMLQYDICMAKVKPYACLSYEHNAIIHFNEQFELVKVTECPFDTGNVLAMSYQYPYYLLVEENSFICLQEDGRLKLLSSRFHTVCEA